MATFVTQPIAVLGVTLTQNAANAGGDKVSPGASVLFRNGSGSSITVTVAVPGNTKYGVANPAYTYTVPAGAMVVGGPLPQDLANPSDNLVALTYSGVTSLTVSPFSL